MHALPSHPKHPFLLAALALLVALTLMAAAAPDLGTLDLSLGRDGVVVTQDTAPTAGPAGAPRWVAEPLAAPLDGLAAVR